MKSRESSSSYISITRTCAAQRIISQHLSAQRYVVPPHLQQIQYLTDGLSRSDLSLWQLLHFEAFSNSSTCTWQHFDLCPTPGNTWNTLAVIVWSTLLLFRLHKCRETDKTTKVLCFFFNVATVPALAYFVLINSTQSVMWFTIHKLMFYWCWMTEFIWTYWCCSDRVVLQTWTSSVCTQAFLATLASFSALTHWIVLQAM